MEKRVTFLEDQLSSCLDNLESVSLQLTVMQNFLQKQFGSRFADYAANQGILIQNNFKNNSTKPTSCFSNSKANKMPRLSPQQHLRKKSNLKPVSRPLISDFLMMGLDNDDVEYTEEDYKYDEADAEGESDPLAFVEIVDDTNDLKEEVEEDEEIYDDEQYSRTANNTNKEGHFFLQQEETSYEQDFNSDLVIVNCRTTVKDQKKPLKINGELLSTNHQNPPKKTYSNRRLAGAEVARKRPHCRSPLVNPANPQSSNSPLPKMRINKLPLLLPKPEPQQQSQQQIIKESNLSSTFPSAASSTNSPDEDSILTSGGGGEEINIPETEDLREYYNILADKSVQCKICQKVLKAGWHKFGRHYRTHTGEKPFSCPYCLERFARKDNMHNHMKSKHEHIKTRGAGSSRQPIQLNADEYTPMYYVPTEHELNFAETMKIIS